MHAICEIHNFRLSAWAAYSYTIMHASTSESVTRVYNLFIIRSTSPDHNSQGFIYATTKFWGGGGGGGGGDAQQMSGHI